MGYTGGKYRTGKAFVQALVDHVGEGWETSEYFEPFCGALGLTYHVVNHERGPPAQLHLSDTNALLVELWQASIMDMWDPPPTIPTKHEFLVCKRSPLSGVRWRKLKTETDMLVTEQDFVQSDTFPRPLTKAWIGWVGLVACFRGNFMGQYEHNAKKIAWASASIRSVIESMRRWRDRLSFSVGSYTETLPNLVKKDISYNLIKDTAYSTKATAYEQNDDTAYNLVGDTAYKKEKERPGGKVMLKPKNKTIIVCDPPYMNCSGYRFEFDADLFWNQHLVQMSREAQVYVCEYLHNVVQLNEPRNKVIWQQSAVHGWMDRYSSDKVRLEDCLVWIDPS